MIDVQSKIKDVIEIFEHFINGDWHFINENIYPVLNSLSEEEREEFNADCKTIEWY